MHTTMPIFRQRSQQLLLLATLLLLLIPNGVHSAVSPSEFSKYWKDPASIIQNFDDYQALWIKVHNCVWSECAVDDNDDDGEGRDGDENWYKARTQEFCANVAYSLYGIKKDHIALPLMECTRATYIDSYFTYGGADTLLRAVGKDPHQYFSDYGYYNNKNNNHNNNNNYYNDDGNNNNKNDDYYKTFSSQTQAPNSHCHVLADDDNYNWRGEEDGQRKLRVLQDDDLDDTIYKDDDAARYQFERMLSGDNNEDYLSGVSSTLGCSADGKFALAVFQGKTCDGNYFLDTTEKATKYNWDIHMTCHKIYGRSTSKFFQIQLSNYQNPARYLLENSWSCDLEIYPHGCPDPYGIKRRYANALHAVANGQNPDLAMMNGRLKRPFRIMTALFFLMAFACLILGYYMKNRERMLRYSHEDDDNNNEDGKKGFDGNNARSSVGKKGFIFCFTKVLIEDYKSWRQNFEEERKAREEIRRQNRQRRRERRLRAASSRDKGGADDDNDIEMNSRSRSYIRPNLSNTGSERSKRRGNDSRSRSGLGSRGRSGLGSRSRSKSGSRPSSPANADIIASPSGGSRRTSSRLLGSPPASPQSDNSRTRTPSRRELKEERKREKREKKSKGNIIGIDQLISKGSKSSKSGRKSRTANSDGYLT